MNDSPRGRSHAERGPMGGRIERRDYSSKLKIARTRMGFLTIPVHLPCPPLPPPYGQSQRRRGGRVSQPVDPWTRGERENGGGGVTSQVERGRGGATPATAETSVVRKTFRRVDVVIPT